MTDTPIDPPVSALTIEDLKGTPRVAQVLEKVFFKAISGDLDAARLYLAKVMPDVKSVDVNLRKPVEDMEDGELRRLIEHLTGVIAAQSAQEGDGAARVSAATH